MYRRSTLHTLLALATATATFLGLASGATAQSPTVIKLGWTTSDGEQDPYAVGARAFKRSVERDSRGRIEVQLFPNRALGDERFGFCERRATALRGGGSELRFGKAELLGLR